MSEKTESTICERLQIEADLCRNDGVRDIAILLDHAATQLTQLRAELKEAKENINRLLDAGDEFLASPPDDMKDFMPFGQPTTAIDCRQLIAAHHIASAFLEAHKKTK